MPTWPCQKKRKSLGTRNSEGMEIDVSVNVDGVISWDFISTLQDQEAGPGSIKAESENCPCSAPPSTQP